MVAGEGVASGVAGEPRARAEFHDERELEAVLLRGIEALPGVARAHGYRDVPEAAFEDPASADVRRADLVPFATPRRCRRRYQFARSCCTHARVTQRSAS